MLPNPMQIRWDNFLLNLIILSVKRRLDLNPAVTQMQKVKNSESSSCSILSVISNCIRMTVLLILFLRKKVIFLVNASDRTTRFTRVRVPEGDYSKVQFVLGVDSLRSTMPVEKRTGVLSFNPESGHAGGGMYWGWNSGYIFLKLEGYCDLISDNQQGDPTGNKQFKYHIGGFGGYNAPTLNNIKTITIDLQSAGIAQVRAGMRSNAHLFVDIMKIFNGPNAFSIVAHPNVMFSEYSVNIANNFPAMFSHDHTENFVKSEDEL